MRRKSCLTFLLNSNHQINFKPKSTIRSGDIKEKGKAAGRLLCRGTGRGCALVLPKRHFVDRDAAQSPVPGILSHFILKYSISGFWDEFVSVRLSLQQPPEFKRLLFPLGSCQLTPNFAGCFSFRSCVIGGFSEKRDPVWDEGALSGGCAANSPLCWGGGCAGGGSPAQASPSAPGRGLSASRSNQARWGPATSQRLCLIRTRTFPSRLGATYSFLLFS